jgi:hypothetical protein
LNDRRRNVIDKEKKGKKNERQEFGKKRKKKDIVENLEHTYVITEVFPCFFLSCKANARV